MGSGKSSWGDGTLVGILLSPLRLALLVAVRAGLLLALAWSIDGYFVSQVWPRGIEHLKDRLAADLARGVALAAMQGGSAAHITAPANAIYAMVFESTGIHGMAQRFADTAPLSIPDTVLRGVFVAHPDAIQVAMLGTQSVGVRLAILVRFLPLLLLLLTIGTVDGLAQRAIRAGCGGRESASLYHRAKHLQMTLLALGMAVILVWPGSIAWQLCAGTAAVVSGLLARAQWAFYKKHL